ncbi:MAG: succinate--CoA ligase subunit alpha [Candidatus Omnitrophica bacterium]|nr:MAG: Succinyl-CoA ligase (ADP-forming) subunit alpha [Candidatus Hinthialibacteria bacterium OLB16]MBV6480510.1 Succinate--CoA ligase [ADP-forming] subunit alpha [bacterium]MCC6733526.1 succinate--CoA ligase subunit alpha [Candidatus Omnitrophota bacterium]MCK6494859.1 succinate--CoA ligase subunit alpha [bacterium]MCL4734215.1 succinate--CoA ligase subunit alpha [Candidatus Omnitrophota bacterium]
MSILLDEKSRVVVQGLTGKEGSFHAEQCLAYGTNIVAGVTPGKGGTTHLDRPIYDTVHQAVDKQGADVSLIFVPASVAADAILEAKDAGIRLAIVITEGIPTLDMARVHAGFQDGRCRWVGPNCPGVISPGKAKAGIMPGFIHKQGSIGVISRSGTLTYEAVKQLTDVGLGQSTCIGIGGDPVIGTRFVDALALFAKDPETRAVVMIGEIGGEDEENAAEWIRTSGFDKPVIGFIAGRTAPPGRRMGHAGAIISGGKGTAAAKMEAMQAAGIHVCDSPAVIGSTTVRALKG